MEKQNLSQKDALEMLRNMNIGFTQANLGYLAMAGDVKKVELLLIGGLNPNDQYENSEKKTVFVMYELAKSGSAAMMDLLITYGAKINAQNNFKDTALVIAIEKGNNEVAKFLIEKGADLNIITGGGMNALFLAKKKKNNEIAELLIKAGARDLTADELKTHKKKKMVGKIILLVIVALLIGIGQFFSKHSGSSSNSSTNSSSSGGHKCTWCGQSYSGSGYNHLGGTGAQSYCAAATNGWEEKDQCCSMKCCEESSNGKR
jgi:ankyrin repeat protein